MTDGGVYDNMGLEPVTLLWRIQRYQSIQDTQARALRKRFLISGYTQGTLNGAHFGVASSPTRYPAARDPGYSKALLDKPALAASSTSPVLRTSCRDGRAPRAGFALIRNIRTDLDAFGGVEQAVLMNHGYSLVDAAIRTHAPELILVDAAFALSFPAFAPPTMAEDELSRRLAGSENRKWAGRR